MDGTAHVIIESSAARTIGKSMVGMNVAGNAVDGALIVDGTTDGAGRTVGFAVQSGHVADEIGVDVPDGAEIVNRAAPVVVRSSGNIGYEIAADFSNVAVRIIEQGAPRVSYPVPKLPMKSLLREPICFLFETAAPAPIPLVPPSA